jgi:hypothetical protein
VLPTNVVAVRPNPRAAGYVPAGATAAVQASGRGQGEVLVDVINSGLVPDGHLFKIDFSAPSPDSLSANRYSLRDSTAGELLFDSGADLAGAGVGPVGLGLLVIIRKQTEIAVDSRSGFAVGSDTDAVLRVSYLPTLPINRLRPGFPDDISIVFADAVQDTGLGGPPFVVTPAKFRVIAHSAGGDQQLDFRFRDVNGDGTLSHRNDAIDIVTYLPTSPDTIRSTWFVTLDPGVPLPASPPRQGDRYELRLTRPFAEDDSFLFTSVGETIDPSRVQEEFSPYVVPNPYVGSASFEPERFAVSGRGERRLEFRGLPSHCVIRIYNVKGERIQTLRHDGSQEGYIAWDLRTKESLDVAPGLYIFQVDGGAAGNKTGKFAIIK